MESKKHFVSWDEYFKLCSQIVHQLKGREITDIIGISRGGLIPAQYIAYQHGIRRIHNYGVSSYTDDNKRLSDSKVNIYQNITTPFYKEHSILIVDDIADTGKTIEQLLKRHNYFSNARNIFIATLHYKPRKSIVRPDFFGQEVDNDTWIQYPYDNV